MTPKETLDLANSYTKTHLFELCKEIKEWRKEGFLTSKFERFNELKEILRPIYHHHASSLAQDFILHEAVEYIVYLNN